MSVNKIKANGKSGKNPKDCLEPGDTSLSHKEALQKVRWCILAQDLPGLIQACAFVNWDLFHRDGDIQYKIGKKTKNHRLHNEHSLLALFFRLCYRFGGSKLTEIFIQDALSVMVRSGYRALNDEVILYEPIRQDAIKKALVKSCHKDQLRHSNGGHVGHVLTEHYLVDRDFIGMMMVEGLDLNVQDDNGNTVFHFIWQGRELRGDCDFWKDLVGAFLKNGADPKLVNANGESGQDVMIKALKDQQGGGMCSDSRELWELYQTLMSERESVALRQAVADAQNLNLVGSATISGRKI